MAGNVIWYVTILGCAVLFCGIGIYARKSEKAMWFWAGSTVDPSTITDVKAYNGENGRMWLMYSLWYWVAGIAWIWSKAVALIALVLGCSVGIVLLVRSYLRIEKKYKKTGL